MTQEKDRATRIAARNRTASKVRKVTVGVAVSAAALTAALTGTIAAVSADTGTAATDNSSATSTTTNQGDSSGDWGTSPVPQQSTGGASHTSSGGS